jgi:hypothetical protein
MFEEEMQPTLGLMGAGLGKGVEVALEPRAATWIDIKHIDAAGRAGRKPNQWPAPSFPSRSRVLKSARSNWPLIGVAGEGWQALRRVH